MDKKVIDCLNGSHGSYLLPFLWLHGEPQERVREEIIAIKNSGISEFCAESRPYDNFCKEQWWDDFGFILKTARELGMRVWLLDDRKFPTGYANGYLEVPERAHLRKKLIREYQSEAVGPMKNAKIFVGGRLKSYEKILRVVAFRYSDSKEGLDFTSAVDLIDTLCDGMVYWSIPSGVWRVCVTVETDARASFKEERFFNYVDMLNPDSCRAMIDAVYAPHYEHFAEYFGNTFVGFFSDEPGFLNTRGSYHNTLGKMYSPYPWSSELPALIAQSSGLSEDEVNKYIPALWEDLGGVTAAVRMHYMEVITKLYSKNFCCMIGNWCREHGVMYIGHVIEDTNAHMRMGYGSGHFFRALDGQDMAGMDIVLIQDIPGSAENIHRASLGDGGVADPAFFRYTLPKLAASHSHIQPLKKNRAMCEIFGAFGWAEGLPYMKGLADIMLASGINYFVPHAFSPKEEDPDCPPHFYNGGRNIQYPLFKDLMNYMGRCSHILDGGVHRADVAVYYNAEGEWTGGRNQLFQEVCRALTRNLLDFDIVPFDTLAGTLVKDGRLYINEESYGALIVSESEIMPFDRLALFAELARRGLPVIFTESLPTASAEGKDISSVLPSLEAVPTDALAVTLRERGIFHIDGEGEGLESLRFYHVARDGKDVYLFSNEAIYGTVDARLTLANKGKYLIYDPWDNKCYRGETLGGKLRLRIEKGNMLFVIFGEEPMEGIPAMTYEAERKPLDLRFDISVKEEGEAEFRTVADNSELFDISAPSGMPYFSGEIRYVTELDSDGDFTVIDLGEVGETAELWLNGEYIGARINAPYKFDLSGALKDGKNALEIIVRSNLAHRRRDKFSSFIQISPSGIMGDIALCRYEK